MTLALLFLMLALVTLYTSIQTLYLESMRLRTRDLPALQFFKAELDKRLGQRSEEGSLTFSICKHLCLVLAGVLTAAYVVDGGYMNPAILAESALIAAALMVVFSYLIPQLLYRRTKGEWLLAFIPFFIGTALVLKPFVAALNLLHSLLEITQPEAGANEVPTSAENIQALIEAGRDEGLIEEEDRKLIQSVVEFGDKVVSEVMTPRPNMVAIQIDRSLEQLRELVVNEQYSRIPVYESSIDDIVGFVHVRDMFEVGEAKRRGMHVRELIRPINLVPETKPVNDLMREMQREGAHMVIVIDEYGNVSGLATMEDLVEVILGEIRDEHEPVTDVTEDGKGGFIVSGNFDLSRLSEVLDFRPDEDIESTTIGGLVTEWLGHVPKPGEHVQQEGIRIEILASDELRVEQVRISKPAIVAREEVTQ